MRLPAIFLGAALLCGGAEARAPTLVEKGYDKCHHAVYGQAEIALQTGAFVSAGVGTVPLVRVGPCRGIRFNPSTYTFTVQHTGTYVINYFMQVISEASNQSGYVSMAVSVNGATKGRMSIVTNQTTSDGEYVGDVASGNGSIFENLRKGDEVSLVITKVNNITNPLFAPLDNNISAYLSLHKTETSN